MNDLFFLIHLCYIVIKCHSQGSSSIFSTALLLSLKVHMTVGSWKKRSDTSSSLWVSCVCRSRICNALLTISLQKFSVNFFVPSLITAFTYHCLWQLFAFCFMLQLLHVTIVSSVSSVSCDYCFKRTAIT